MAPQAGPARLLPPWRMGGASPCPRGQSWMRTATRVSRTAAIRITVLRTDRDGAVAVAGTGRELRVTGD